MRKLVLFACAVLGLNFALTANTREESKSETILKRLGVLRTLNTLEYNYKEQYGRFGDRDQLLMFFRKSGATEGAGRLEHLQPFELSVTTSPDGAHYQISLTPTQNDANKEVWCDKAGFTDERGLIFLGTALGCEGKEPDKRVQ